MSNLILPSNYTSRNAQLSTKIIFYYYRKIDRITMGFPENFPTPPGAEKIVCNSTREAEIWSERLRQQDKREEEMSDYERELIEGPAREEARKELQNLMANAKDQLNRDFCRYALEQLDEMEKHGKWVRESYLHAEAFEAGK